MAATGHSGEPDILGTVINLTSLAYCKVFDHLINITIFPGLNITSPWASCFKGENAAMACGTKLDILRNEKNASKYMDHVRKVTLFDNFKQQQNVNNFLQFNTHRSRELFCSLIILDSHTLKHCHIQTPNIKISLNG